jgi:hypothetical protein
MNANISFWFLVALGIMATINSINAQRKAKKHHKKKMTFLNNWIGPVIVWIVVFVSAIL